MMKQTASQTVGPFFRIGLIYGEPQNVLVNERTSGERIVIEGQVLDGNSDPVPDAMVEIWQADAQGIFNHPNDPLHGQADPHFRGFGRAENRDDGNYRFETIRPGGRDGQAPYIDARVFARGMLIHVVTRIYFSDEPANEGDSLLESIEPERRPTLIAQRDPAAEPPTYRFDIRLQGEGETVFFDL